MKQMSSYHPCKGMKENKTMTTGTLKVDAANKGIASMVKDATTLENVVVEEDEKCVTIENVAEEDKGIE